MKSIDLHNLPHEVAERVVFNFIMNNCDNMPVEIITGKSEKMRNIVIDIIKDYGWSYHEQYYDNYGCLVIMENKHG